MDLQIVSSLRRGTRNLWSEGRGKILTAISMGWLLSLGIRMIYPVLLPYLREAYGLDFTTAGLLLTMLWLAFALGQLPGGLLTDRIGKGNILVATMLIAAGTILIITTARSAIVLFASTILLGFTVAFYSMAMFTSLPDIYPDQVGASLGVSMASGDAGNAILPPLASFVAVTVAWQFGFGFVIPLFLVVALWLWWAVPSWTSEITTDVDTLSSDRIHQVISGLRKPSIAYGTLIMILYFSTWLTFTGFYPTYLIEVKEVSSTVSSILFGLFFAMGIVIKPLSGGTFDRFGIRRSLLGTLAVSVLAFGSLPFVSEMWAFVIVTVGASTFLGCGAITLSYLLDALPNDVRGTGFGVLRTGYSTIGALGPVLFGAAVDRGFFNEGFLVLAGLAALIIILALKVPEQPETTPSRR